MISGTGESNGRARRSGCRGGGGVLPAGSGYTLPKSRRGGRRDVVLTGGGHLGDEVGDVASLSLGEREGLEGAREGPLRGRRGPVDGRQGFVRDVELLGGEVDEREVVERRCKLLVPSTTCNIKRKLQAQNYKIGKHTGGLACKDVVHKKTIVLQKLQCKLESSKDTEGRQESTTQ